MHNRRDFISHCFKAAALSASASPLLALAAPRTERESLQRIYLGDGAPIGGTVTFHRDGFSTTVSGNATESEFQRAIDDLHERARQYRESRLMTAMYPLPLAFPEIWE